MHRLSTPAFIIKRIADDWKLLLSVFLGITIAASLIAGAPVYIRTLERLSLNTAIDRSSNVFLNLFVSAPHIPLNKGSLDRTDRSLDQAVRANTSQIYRGRERLLRAPVYLVGLPWRPLPTADGNRVSRGYFQHLSNLQRHVTFVEGTMATDAVSAGPRGPIVEAVVGTTSARVFDLKIGDSVTLTPSLGDPTRISATIVGIIDPIDRSEEYWHGNSGVLLEPQPLTGEPDLEIEVDPEEPPVPLFITQHAMAEGLGRAYPGTLVSSSWVVFVDKERLKGWSIAEARDSLKAVEDDVLLSMQGSVVLTGIKKLMRDFERRSFFSSVPLLLLLSIMVITVLYYLSMMVSYLVQSRESDVALLRTRGVSTPQLLRLYALEGIVLTVVAIVLAPFIAMGTVAIAGKLPYFREITGGALLPVDLHWMPFAVAAGAGLLGLAIFVVPGVFGARAGLVLHKLRSSRPPSVPFFQRYYIDIGLLVVGGLIFWELRARGHIVSGGLFKDVQVNEALLLAPVLFLTVVALLFMRFFPLFVRFVSGESPALLNLVAAATVVSLAPATVVREVRDGGGLAWLLPVALLMALAWAYWATSRARRVRPRLGGLALQAGLVGLFVVAEPPVFGEVGFVPTISLMSMVPAQVVFLLFRGVIAYSPVWVSMSLWHMARNPLQYTWLVLLLVLVTGLGVMATTVGGTLDRSQRERVLYEVAADVRVGGIPGYIAVGRAALKERYSTVPGVRDVSLALRSQGMIGTTFAGRRFEVLALSPDFHYLSWYRDDFSALPLSAVMGKLRSGSELDQVAIPNDATSIGVWVKPEDSYPGVFLWMVLEDARGAVSTVALGELDLPEWTLMSTEIPTFLKSPLQLASVQLFERVFGPAGTPGTILLDDIHVTVGGNGESQVIDDFESRKGWAPLATSIISSDLISYTRDGAYRGDRSGRFSFGKDTDRGIRGFYSNGAGRGVPVVASSSFAAASGAGVHDSLIVDVMGRLIPIVVADTVNYFPTLYPNREPFLLFDLDSLLRHINILSPRSTTFPNEIFVREAPGAGESVRESLLGLSMGTARVHDKDSLLESIRLDPLISAGWRAMVLLSMAIIVFTAGLGYITYLVSFADRTVGEMGFLRALGLTGRQMTGLLSLEHLVIIIIGLGLGTWAGFQMSALMVSSVTVTETGGQVVPPFILITDWTFMLQIYGVLMVIFLSALYGLIRGMRRLNLQSIVRVEG